MSLEFPAWDSAPLDFSRITVTVILIKATVVMVVIM